MAKLLMVEDDETVLQGLEGLLAIVYGHQVRAVMTGEAALSALEVDRPDLIITDVKLPGITGLHLVEAVRAHPGRENLPILVISATATYDLEQRIEQLEGVTYLRKPFGPEHLQQAVAEALAAHAGSEG